MLRVFISHSSQDVRLAKALVDLLSSALRLSAGEIRCTSVDGYRFPSGVDTDQQIRDEITTSEAFIGLLTESSLNSTYVVFELGARWGINKHIIPLLGASFDPARLSGPLARLNALTCNSGSQLHQLISELAVELGIDPSSPAVYQDRIDKIKEIEGEHLGAGTTVPASAGRARAPKVVTPRPRPSELGQVVEDRIKKRVAAAHPKDFSTQRHLIQEQLESWRSLEQYFDLEVPEEIQAELRLDIERRHPDDYSTQLHLLKQQIADWKALHLGS